jgi:hypothetical protein
MYRTMWDGFGAEPFDGLIVHVATRREGGGLRYFQVWESKDAQQRAFRERVLPVMQRVFPTAGLPPGPPQITELDVIDVRQGTGRA